MSDSSWFFPKQQNVQGDDVSSASSSSSVVPDLAPIAPTSAPLIPEPTASSQEAGMRSLDEALFEIEQDMPNAVVSEEKPTLPHAHEDPHEHRAAPHNPRMELLKHTLEDIKKNVQKAIELINDEQGGHHHVLGADHHLAQLVPGMAIDTTRHTYHPTHTPPPHPHHGPAHGHETAEDDSNAIEGIFDGQGMVGPDGKQYSIPPNYASKSKLVEGDVLKLNISHNGSFIYKQIGPAARRRVVGLLETDPETHTFIVKGEGHVWRVITASVTYFKGVVGDEVVILIPRDKPSKWAAVENIIKKF